MVEQMIRCLRFRGLPQDLALRVQHGMDGDQTNAAVAIGDRLQPRYPVGGPGTRGHGLSIIF